MKLLDLDGVLREFGLYGREDVADLASGAGHFALAAAKRLEGGRLFAVDAEHEMLTRLVAEAHARGLTNLHPLRGDITKKGGVPLGDASLDRTLLANVLFSASDRNAVLEETRRILKVGGKVLLIEWRDDHLFGPHAKHKVSKDDAGALFARHGFTKERDIETGDLQYGMIFVRT